MLVAHFSIGEIHIGPTKFMRIPHTFAGPIWISTNKKICWKELTPSIPYYRIHLQNLWVL